MDQALVKKTSEYLLECGAMNVATKEDYEVAGVIIQVGLDLQKSIKSVYSPLKKAAQDAHKKIVDEEKKRLEPIVAEVSILKKKQSDWLIEEEKKRRAEEEALRAEAEKKGMDESMVQVAKPEVTLRKGQRKQYTFKYTNEPLKDIDILYLWNAGLLMYNDKAVREIVNKKGEEAEIPGVEVSFYWT